MSAVDDTPIVYKEIERYLQKAQDEIGLALTKLTDDGDVILTNESTHDKSQIMLTNKSTGDRDQVICDRIIPADDINLHTMVATNNGQNLSESLQNKVHQLLEVFFPPPPTYSPSYEALHQLSPRLDLNNDNTQDVTTTRSHRALSEPPGDQNCNFTKIEKRPASCEGSDKIDYDVVEEIMNYKPKRPETLDIVTESRMEDKTEKRPHSSDSSTPREVKVMAVTTNTSDDDTKSVDPNLPPNDESTKTNERLLQNDDSNMRLSQDNFNSKTLCSDFTMLPSDNCIAKNASDVDITKGSPVDGSTKSYDINVETPSSVSDVPGSLSCNKKASIVKKPRVSQGTQTYKSSLCKLKTESVCSRKMPTVAKTTLYVVEESVHSREDLDATVDNDNNTVISQQATCSTNTDDNTKDINGKLNNVIDGELFDQENYIFMRGTQCQRSRKGRNHERKVVQTKCIGTLPHVSDKTCDQNVSSLVNKTNYPLQKSKSINCAAAMKSDPMRDMNDLINDLVTGVGGDVELPWSTTVQFNGEQGTEEKSRGPLTLLDRLHHKYYAHQYKEKTAAETFPRSQSCRGVQDGSGFLHDNRKMTHSRSLDHKVGRRYFTVPLSNSQSAEMGSVKPETSTDTKHVDSSTEVSQCTSVTVLDHPGRPCTPNDSDTTQSAHSTPSLPVRGQVKGQVSPKDTSPLSSGSLPRKHYAVTDKDVQLLKGDRERAELEALEACRWLRAAGFPQYAQMYEDLQFPISITSVERDHDFLEPESLQSLFRRLNTLNKCASMKIETPIRQMGDESEEEDECALSDRWRFQRNSRRWSRRDLDMTDSDRKASDSSSNEKLLKSCSSRDSVITDDSTASPHDDSPELKPKEIHTRPTNLCLSNGGSMIDRYGKIPTNLFEKPSSYNGDLDNGPVSPRLHRAASERLKDAKNNFLKKMETLKRRKTKRTVHEGQVEISGPVLMDSPEMQERMLRLGCVDISPTSEHSPLLTGTSTFKTIPHSRTASDTTGLTYQKDSSSDSGSTNTLKERSHSDGGSEIHSTYYIPSDHKPGTFPMLLSNGFINAGNGTSINYRTGSVNLGSESDAYRDSIRNNHATRRRVEEDPCRMSIYDNVPLISPDSSPNTSQLTPQEELDQILDSLYQDISGLNLYLSDSTSMATLEEAGLNNEEQGDHNDSVCTMSSVEITQSPVSSPNVQDSAMNTDSHITVTGNHIDPHDIEDGPIMRERRDSGVGSSLTRAPSDRRRHRIRWHSFQKSHRPSFNSRALQINNMSAGQLMVLKKLSLLKMTATMEAYSPSNRTGWNWVMPKFIKRFKAPDYKDRNVFGVPLLIVLQRTGQPLPQCILYAMRYLRRTATDAVGIFRKSGVRSRIQKLRNQIESNPEMANYESMQAYDVADLLKQYFRELPECLLTNKLSETFINIFTHVPVDKRLDALQAAIVLMPDENREVLQSLLLFLSDMAQHSDENQMTASNLAVCFAPSLFHMSGPRNNQIIASPKRNRKNLGVPDQKELLEQKAAHECLTQMIVECKRVFIIPEDTLMKCKFSYMEQGDPVTLEELSKKRSGQDYTSHIETCIQGLLKESRDKFKGWLTVNSDNDVAYKKVGDGHPLRLWKCSVDVEAPPVEVLNRLLRERHLWDDDYSKWRIVEMLDNQTEVIQYVVNSMAPHPSRDFCELRSWRTDLPKGACVLVSTSIDHGNAPLLGGVRAVVLASRYLIEHSGSGKSRLTHICRVDTRGRSPEWYNKAYGQMSTGYMSRIRDSFRQTTDGPETKV